MKTEATIKKYERATKLPAYGSLSTISRFCGAKKEILDVGCASGYLGRVLMDRDNVVYGIDGNAEAVAEAKQIYTEAVCFDLNNLDGENFFGGKTFDVIVFADVLEHLLDPQVTLQYFKRFLKPGGYIITSLPNVALWRVRLNLLFGNFNYTDYGVLDRTHLHLYTFASAKKLLSSAGYEVVASRAAMNLLLFGILVDFFPFLRTWLGIHIVMKARVR